MDQMLFGNSVDSRRTREFFSSCPGHSEAASLQHRWLPAAPQGSQEVSGDQDRPGLWLRQDRDNPAASQWDRAADWLSQLLDQQPGLGQNLPDSLHWHCRWSVIPTVSHPHCQSSLISVIYTVKILDREWVLLSVLWTVGSTKLSILLTVNSPGVFAFLTVSSPDYQFSWVSMLLTINSPDYQFSWLSILNNVILFKCQFFTLSVPLTGSPPDCQYSWALILLTCQSSCLVSSPHCQL